MCNGFPNFCKKYRFFSIVFTLFILNMAVLYAQEGAADSALPPAVQKLAQKAFSQPTETAVRQMFEQNLASLAGAQEQCHALILLAEYELHTGSYYHAAAHYRQAAALNTEEHPALLLEAVRVLLCGGSFDSARSLLSEIAATLPVSEENRYYRTAAVYDAWRLLAEDRPDRALPLISAYAEKQAFAEYHPALLFTLWWTNGDEAAKARLLKDYPAGMEAAAVRGAVAVQPSTFWYLMPRSSRAIGMESDQSETAPGSAGRAYQPGSRGDSTSAADAGAAPSHQKAVQAQNGNDTQTKPLYYQLGFYRTKKYAEAFADDLKKKHFTPIIKEETRPSGTVYFAVLVAENAAGDMGLLLKDAGYEAFPIFP